MKSFYRCMDKRKCSKLDF